MIKVGVAGTIASGKTTVSILLRRHGFAVFNSDNYAKMATHAGNPCFDALIEVIGEECKDASGDIDRQKMADVIFHDEEKRKAVNAIVHPYVIEGMLKFFSSHQDKPFVFAEVPLLFEAGMEKYFDHICVVTCKKETAIARMMEDRDYTEEQAEARYNSQIDSLRQVEMADTVLDNDEDLKKLNEKVNKWIAQLRKEARNGNQTA